MKPTTESPFAEMKRFVGLTPLHENALRALGIILEPHRERMAKAFYDRIREHEHAHAVFTGEDQIQRLQRSMARWLETFTGGVYDDAHFQERRRIGQVHVRVGLPERYMFTGMSLLQSLCNEVLRSVPDETATLMRESVSRMMHLELAVMVEGYRDHYIERIQRIERMERAELEQALVRNEHRYVNAVELARVIVVGLDAQLRIGLFNREAETTSGYARDEALGHSFVSLLIPPEDSAQDESARSSVASQLPTRVRLRSPY